MNALLTPRVVEVIEAIERLAAALYSELLGAQLRLGAPVGELRARKCIDQEFVPRVEPSAEPPDCHGPTSQYTPQPVAMGIVVLRLGPGPEWFGAESASAVAPGAAPLLATRQLWSRHIGGSANHE